MGWMVWFLMQRRDEYSASAMLPELDLLAALGMVGTTDAGDMRQ